MYNLLKISRIKNDLKNYFNVKKNINNIIKNKFYIIIGPCSLSNVKDFNKYLKNIYYFKNKINLIIRIYYEKPRTSIGWKGYIYDPYIDNSYSILDSIYIIRRLFIDTLNKKFNIGVECLTPFFYNYFDDCIVWVCIGARTTLSQIHREFCSDLKCIVAIKNDISGNLSHFNNTKKAIEYNQIFLQVKDEFKIIKTKGNNLIHYVLRGGTLPNFEICDNNNYIIDCSHDNSNKVAINQLFVFENVINQFLYLNKNLIGLMFESNLKLGNQNISNLYEGVSITDSCIDIKISNYIIKTILYVLNE